MLLTQCLLLEKMSKLLIKHLIFTEIFKNYVTLRFSRTNLFVYKNRHLWFKEKNYKQLHYFAQSFFG